MNRPMVWRHADPWTAGTGVRSNHHVTPRAPTKITMTLQDMCLWHPACTPIPERSPCPLEVGPDLTPCLGVTEWLVQNWTQPGVPLSRLCTPCAAHALCEIPLCGDAECGASGIDCTHPLPIAALRQHHHIAS